MLYGDNKLYERALDSHTRHGEKWGYPTYIKRQNEYCGYWNKPTFMIQQVAQELAKPERERAEWLMCVSCRFTWLGVTQTDNSIGGLTQIPSS